MAANFLSSSVSVIGSGVALVEEIEASGAGSFPTIHPNPFSGETWIQIEGGRAATAGRPARIGVFDTSGRLVPDLTPMATGDGRSARVSWDGADASGDAAPPGVYFIRMEDGASTAVRKSIRLH